MIRLIIEILILSVFCNGLYIAAEDGMILSRPNRWMEKKLPLWIYKPLLGCIYCMASIWGAVVHLVLSGIANLHYLPILIICGCFTNGFVRTLYDLVYVKAYTKTFDLNEPHEGANS